LEKKVKRANPLGLSDEERGGVFYLFGDDQFRKEEEGRALVEWHLDPGTRDFNFDSLRGTEVNVENLASVLATPPLMAEWRVVLLREVEALVSIPKARNLLLGLAKGPPPGLALILLASLPKGSTAKFYRELKRLACSVEFPGIAPNDVPGWLVEWTATRHERTMTEDAARALGSSVGTDLGVLAQEVEKLVSVVEEGAPIDLKAVQDAGTHVPQEDRWVWMDRVGQRDLGGALNGLEALFSQGESGVGLIIGLATHLLRLGVARTETGRVLENSLPPHQKWLASRLRNQAANWTVDDLEDALLGLRRADRLLKSSNLGEEHILEEWLLRLMARERAT
jgi:DNA polymerase-3 subunit delta